MTYLVPLASLNSQKALKIIMMQSYRSPNDVRLARGFISIHRCVDIIPSSICKDPDNIGHVRAYTDGPPSPSKFGATAAGLILLLVVIVPVQATIHSLPCSPTKLVQPAHPL